MQMSIAMGLEPVGTIGANAPEYSVAYAKAAYAESDESRYSVIFMVFVTMVFMLVFVASLENASAKVWRVLSPTTGVQCGISRTAACRPLRVCSRLGSEVGCSR